MLRRTTQAFTTGRRVPGADAFGIGCVKPPIRQSIDGLRDENGSACIFVFITPMETIDFAASSS
jgi:hypothetical protein